MDTPLPHVYVNILYLDEGQEKTQFMMPNWTGIKIEEFRATEPPLKDPFVPIDTEKKKFDVSEKWRKYLKEKFVFHLLYLPLY